MAERGAFSAWQITGPSSHRQILLTNHAAKRLQLRTWPLGVRAPSLRAFMSSIMRWRNGVIVFALME